MPSQNNAAISLCMIVRNEEDNLRACLAPISHLFDEIVIVDTGSEDCTKQIAREFTPHVFDFKWCENFSAARNESLRHAHGDWIFWLDADDRMLPDSLENFASILQHLTFEDIAYYFNVISRGHVESDSGMALTHLRLFRNHPDFKWRGRVHEQLSPDPFSLGFRQLLISDVTIQHVGYADPSKLPRKHERNLRLLKLDYADDPEDVSTLMHLGLAYHNGRQLEESNRYLEKLAAKQLPLQSWQRRLYELLAENARAAGELVKAQAYARKGLALFPQDIPLQFLQAKLLFQAGNYDESAAILCELFDSPVTVQFNSGCGSDICNIEVPQLWIDLEIKRNCLSIAEVIAKRWLARVPNHLQAMHSLSQILIVREKHDELLVLRERMRRQPYGEVYAILSMIQEMLHRQELGSVGDLLEQAIQMAPQMLFLRYLRINYLERKNATAAEYISACRDLLKLEPNDAEVRRKMQLVEKLAADAAQVQTQPATHRKAEFSPS